MIGRVHSINVSPGGVPKRAISEAWIDILGVGDDRQGNHRIHGGPDRAVSLYSLELINALRDEGHPIAVGSTGENLTISGLDWSRLGPGIRVRVGGSEIEIADFTHPCNSIAASFTAGNFKRISHKLHPGWSRLYARVLAPGPVAIGDSVEVLAPSHVASVAALQSSRETTTSVTAAVVVIGSSWGGVEAMTRIVRDLPQDFRVPIVIVQHRSSDSEPLLVELLEDKSASLVREPQHNEPLRDRHIYVAPADYHLRIGAGFLTLAADAPVRHSRPSIDVTFSSAAETYGHRTIGVVLSGANADGSRGLRCIADHGGHTIVQDPLSAEMAVMPRAALALVPEAVALPVERIAAHLARIAHDGSAARSAQERRPRI